MKTLDILDILEAQSTQLECARAVLREATRHFERSPDPDSAEAYNLVQNAKHISVLTYVTDGYLRNISQGINGAVDALIEQEKAQKAEDSPETEKANAAHTLSDEISDMKVKYDRARAAIAEPIEDYFGVHNLESEAGRHAILCGYERYGSFVNIAADYLFEIGHTVNSLTDLMLKGIDLAAKERRAQHE